MVKKIIFGLFMGISMLANGGELQEFIENKIESVLEELDLDDMKSRQFDQLSKIRLRVRGKAAIEVPFISKFEVKPLIEMHFKPIQ